MAKKSKEKQVQVYDPFSPEGIREAVGRILEGHNYRLFFEGVTKRRLITTYQNLAKYRMVGEKDDEKWKEAILKIIEEDADKSNLSLRYWLLGLAKKTAENLGVEKASPQIVKEAFNDMIAEIESHSSEMGIRDTALLIWAGAATLTVRGSQKARIGKRLERAIARGILTLIGLSESEGDFRLNIMPDQEVDRETDAEIRTNRGMIRMDVGLIGHGNPEVIDDKISRVGRNGVILFDKLSPNSNAWINAKNERVKLIQMRNSNPVEELRSHLHRLGVPVSNEVPRDEIAKRIMKMDLNMFDFS